MSLQGVEIFGTEFSIRVVKRPAGQKKGGNFIGGLLVPFSNPKVVLFYVSLLPSFVDLADLQYRDCF